MPKALIITQHREARIRLQRLMEYDSYFPMVSTIPDIDDAAEGITEKWDINYVFISRLFDPKEIAGFIEKVRSMPTGEETTFILIGTSDTETSTNVADNMVAGIHGFLCEPFTADAVREVSRLAANVRQQSTQTRLKAATGLMLTEVYKELVGEEKTSLDIWNRVQQACEAYKTATGESITSAIVQPLQDISRAKRVGSYNGASKRVRDLFRTRVKNMIKSVGAAASDKSKK